MTDLAPTPDARSASGDGAAIDAPSVGSVHAGNPDPRSSDPRSPDPRSPDPRSPDPRSPDRWTLALEAGRIGIWEWDLSTNTVWWSHRIHEITGVPPEHFPGTLDGFAELVHPQDRATMRQALESALHGHQVYHLELRLVVPSGRTCWVETRGMVVSDPSGTPTSMIGTAVDVTERKVTEAARESLLHDEQDARARAEATRERLTFLIRAGREIRAVLDPDIVMRTAAELVVPDLGDWALVIEPDGVTIRAWAGAEFATMAWSPGGTTGHCLNEPADMFRQVVATGEPHLFAVPGPLTLSSDGEDPVTVEMTAASIAAVPLHIGGQTMGILTVGHRRSARPYDSGDLALLQQYAEAVSAAIDKALLFEERSAIARVLQQSLLPASLPTVEGIEIETEYQPVGDGLIVGGDFYDVFRISDGRYAFAVGDVSGKGSEAAAVTALVRHSIRAFAETHDDPADVLVAVNDAIRIHGPSLRYCTAVYGVLTLSGTGPGSRVDVTVAVGGHPLPILLRNDGDVEYIGQPGTLLGMFPDVGVKAMAQSLDPGDAIILYTDGVLDSRRAGVPFGDERLRSVLEEAVGQSAASIAGRLGAAVAEYHDEPSDDVAVLVLRRSP